MSKRAPRMLLIALGTLFAGYLALVALTFSFQRQLLFPAPSRTVELTPQSWMNVEKVPAADGRELYFFYVAPKVPKAPTVVYFHGNAEQVADQLNLAKMYADQGMGFAAIEYPGYGVLGSQVASEETLFASAEASIRRLHTLLGIGPAQTILQGHSLGSGVAVEMARRGWGFKLAILSPYTSITAMGERVLPRFLPVRLLSRDPFDTESKAPNIGVPTLIIHGTEDEVIPVAMGKSLARSFPNVTSMFVEGAHHNDLLDRREVLVRLLEFAHSS